MCLHTVSKTDKKPLPRTKICYKVFSWGMTPALRGYLHGWFYRMHIKYRAGLLYHDPVEETIHSTSGRKYRCGYHAFATLKGAQSLASGGDVIRKIRLSSITARGKEGGHETYVGRTMKILSKHNL